jgi:hypothetical protein
MDMRALFVAGVLVGFSSVALSTPFWTDEDFHRAEELRSGPKAELPPPIRSGFEPNYSYPHEFHQICEFLDVWQVHDTASIDYGGEIEAEAGGLAGVIQTDNTQEALWVWSRFYDFTGDTSFLNNVEAAWEYIMNFPAYQEEISPQSYYYRVWNCALGLLCEMMYRHATGDSSYLWYSDTCAREIMANPLPFTGVGATYLRLHPLVTGFNAGCLYHYGLDVGNPAFSDSAVLMGQRVVNWIEDDPGLHLTDEEWAMSAGTAMWGVLNSCFQVDTASALTWLETYAQYMDSLEAPPASPSLWTWDNSWNIWYANAHQAIHGFNGDTLQGRLYRQILHYLFAQDTDEDGGIMASAVHPDTEDMTWITSYVMWQGITPMLDSILTTDVGVTRFLRPSPGGLILPLDTLSLQVEVANFGLEDQIGAEFFVNGVFSTTFEVDLPFARAETLPSLEWVPDTSGTYVFLARNVGPDEDPRNDTLRAEYEVERYRVLQGTVLDTLTALGIEAELSFEIHFGDSSWTFAECGTDPSTGAYEVNLIAASYDISVRPELPYPRVSISGFCVPADSDSVHLDFDLGPALLLLLDDDDGGDYEAYYIEALDSLGLSFHHWDSDEQGIFPLGQMDRFLSKTVIWYTGDDSSTTLTAAEQESLMVYLDAGGDLFLTGQNVAQDLDGSDFLIDYLHAFYQGSNDDHILHGIPGDTVSGGWDAVLTLGGAGNQTSQDEISADSFSMPILVYDTLTSQTAGVRVESAMSGSRLVYLSVGLEGVNAPNPLYTPRHEILGSILEWFGIFTGIRESRERDLSALGLQIAPTLMKRGSALDMVLQAQGGSLVSLDVFDATGRRVHTLYHGVAGGGRISLSWDGRDGRGRSLRSGVYFLRMTAGDLTRVRRICLL